MILKIVDDQGQIQDRNLDDGELTVGRGEDNGLVLDERNVSRHHARIFREDSLWFVEDVASRYGIYLNGERLYRKTALGDGDTLKIGDFAFAFDDIAPGGDMRATTPLLDALDDEEFGLVDESPTKEQLVPPSVRETTDALSAPPEEHFDAPAAEEEADDREDAADEPPPLTSKTPIAADLGADAAADNEPAPDTAAVVSPQFQMKFLGLSGPSAGLEHVLDRSVVTIGRTPDNDFVIDHRSVSVNHARVLFENGHFIVHDLGSTNGVSVNSDPYQSCVLQYNDVIKFGHVKFRFVRPTDSAAALETLGVSEPTEERSVGTGKLIALALLLIVAVTAGFLYVTQFRHPPEDLGSRVTPPEHAPAPVNSKVAPPSAATQKERVASKLAQATAFFEAEKWSESKALFQEVYAETTNTPGIASAKAMAYLDRIKREEQAKKAFDDIAGLRSTSKADEAYALLMSTLRDAPRETAYYERLENLEAALKPEAVRALITKAETLLQAKDPEGALEAARSAIRLDSESDQAMALLEKASERRVAAAQHATPPPKKAVAAPAKVAKTRPAKPKPAPPRPAVDKDANLTGLQLFKKAVKAKMRGDLSSAKSYCFKAIKRSNYAQAHKLLGNIYQAEMNYPKAAKHFRSYIKLSPNAPDAAIIREHIKQIETK